MSFGKKKAFQDGMSAGAKPFEEKFNDLGEKVEANNAENQEKLASLDEAVKASNNNLQQATENISNVNDNVQAMNADVQATGQTVDAMLDNLTKQERFDLYQINNNYDVSTLDETERQHLIGLLYTFSGEFNVNDVQQKYIRHLQAYLEVTEPQIGVKLSSVGNIDSLNTQKIYLQVMMEYDYLNDADNYEEDALSEFSVNRREREKIDQSIKNIVEIVGLDGLIEKYGLKDIDEIEAIRIATEKAHEQIEAERQALDDERFFFDIRKDVHQIQLENEKVFKQIEEMEIIQAKAQREIILPIVVDNLNVLYNISEDAVGSHFIIEPSLQTAELLLEKLQQSGHKDSISTGDYREYSELPTFPVNFDTDYTPERLLFFGNLTYDTKINSWMQIFDDGNVYFEQALSKEKQAWEATFNKNIKENLAYLNNEDTLFHITAYNEKGEQINKENIEDEVRRITTVEGTFGVEIIQFRLQDISETEIFYDPGEDFSTIKLTMEDDSNIFIAASIQQTLEHGLFKKSYETIQYFHYYQDFFDGFIADYRALFE